MRRCTYNGYLSAKLILDLTLLIRIWTFILDDLEELFDAHLGGSCRSVVLRCSMILKAGSWKFGVTRCSRLLRETALSGAGEAKFMPKQCFAVRAFTPSFIHSVQFLRLQQCFNYLDYLSKMPSNAHITRPPGLAT